MRKMRAMFNGNTFTNDLHSAGMIKTHPFVITGKIGCGSICFETQNKIFISKNIETNSPFNNCAFIDCYIEVPLKYWMEFPFWDLTCNIFKDSHIVFITDSEPTSREKALLLAYSLSKHCNLFINSIIDRRLIGHIDVEVNGQLGDSLIDRFVFDQMGEMIDEKTETRI